jgi:hypothetical protein
MAAFFIIRLVVVTKISTGEMILIKKNSKKRPVENKPIQKLEVIGSNFVVSWLRKISPPHKHINVINT